MKTAKLSQYTCAQQQTASGHNRSWFRRRHLSNRGSNRPSKASSPRLNNTKADEASLGNYAVLSSEGQLYHSFPAVKDHNYYTDFPQGDTVQVCWWLFHHHFI